MNVNWGRSDDAMAYVMRSIAGGARGFDNAQAAAVEDKHETLIAGVVFHDWNPEAETIEISAAARDPRWLTRGVAEDVFAYCFSFCQAVLTRTTEDNERVRKIWRSLGAEEHVIPNAAGRGRALVVFVLTDAAWKASKWRKAANG